MFGPYYGPSVYGKVSGDGQWESMKIDYTIGDALRMLRVCENDYMDSVSILRFVINSREKLAMWNGKMVKTVMYGQYPVFLQYMGK